MNPWIVNPVNAGMMIQIHLVQSNDHMKAKMKHLALLLSALFLAACSAGEKPRAAEFIAPTESSIDFGNLRVHYNALPTLSLSEAVASEHGVTRDAESAMLVVALREKVGSEEIPASGKVTAQAFDLQGKQLWQTSCGTSSGQRPTVGREVRRPVAGGDAARRRGHHGP